MVSRALRRRNPEGSAGLRGVLFLWEGPFGVVKTVERERGEEE